MQATMIGRCKPRVCRFARRWGPTSHSICKGEFMVFVHLRGILLGGVALACLIAPPVSTAQAAPGHEATISAAPGTLVRWTAPGATRCSRSEIGRETGR